MNVQPQVAPSRLEQRAVFIGVAKVGVAAEDGVSGGVGVTDVYQLKELLASSVRAVLKAFQVRGDDPESGRIPLEIADKEGAPHIGDGRWNQAQEYKGDLMSETVRRRREVVRRDRGVTYCYGVPNDLCGVTEPGSLFLGRL
jgi:hypothetical protein